MNSLATDTQKPWQQLVAILALLFTAALYTPATSTAQELRKGVSVQMVTTSNATPIPAADNEDAWIVTVTAGGNLYFGADPMTADELSGWMNTHPRNREAKLYIKADARAPFASVEKVLEIGRAAYFEAPVLLTSQAEQTPPGTMVPPRGLEVLVGAMPKAEIVVQINSGQPSPTLHVNDQVIPAADLQDTLRRLLQNRGDMPVLVKASALVPFAAIVRVVDTCHSIGAKVALVTPML